MLKKLGYSLVLTLLFVLGAVRIHAQSDEKKFEVGGQFSSLRVPTRSVTISGSGLAITEARDTNFGFGGRFGYRLSKYFSLEAEANFFPRDRDVDAGRKTQALFGLKAGKRFDKFGVFAKGASAGAQRS